MGIRRQRAQSLLRSRIAKSARLQCFRFPARLWRSLLWSSIPKARVFRVLKITNRAILPTSPLSLPTPPHAQAPPAIPPRRTAATPPHRHALGDGGAEVAHPGAADVGRLDRPCCARGEPHHSPGATVHRRDTAYPRRRSTRWLRSVADRPARRRDEDRPHEDEGGRPAGEGPGRQARRRTRRDHGFGRAEIVARRALTAAAKQNARQTIEKTEFGETDDCAEASP